MKLTVRNGRMLAWLLLLLATPAAAASAGDAAVDPVLRQLFRVPAAERPALFRAASADPGRIPIPRTLLAAQPDLEAGRVEVFLETRGPLSPGGDPRVEIVPIAPGRVAARVPLATLEGWIADGLVASARLSRPVYPTLDRSAEFLDLRRVRRVNAATGEITGTTGRGVVIGDVDTGIDWSHPDFFDPRGGTRIFRYWDQLTRSGSPPVDFGFGLEYRSSSIDNDLAGGIDPDGHGTHVMGIAAGNGLGSWVPDGGIRYAGVAPGATLIAVRTFFTEFGVVVGAHFVFERAALLGYPAVLNLSLGNHFGPHRGTSEFAAALESLVGPGRLIVAAAGNDGHRPIHAEMQLATGEVRTLGVKVPTYDKDPDRLNFLYLEGWYDRGNRYRFTVYSPLGDLVGSFVKGNENVVFENQKGWARGWVAEDLGMGSLVLEIEDNPNSNRLASGIWTVNVEALEVTGDTEVDFWIGAWTGNRPGEEPAFTTFVDPEETIVSPATAPHIVAVGAVATRGCWPTAVGTGEACYAAEPTVGEIAYFSSQGPTADGRDKPEVLAPGFGVIAPRSARASFSSEEDAARRSTPDGLYMINQGTSMAAPMVAGTAALLLEHYPELTYDQLVTRLARRSPSVVDARSGRRVTVLRTGEAVAPVVDLSLSELQAVPEGNRLRWFVGKERENVLYRVYKGFSDEGPFHLLSSHRVTGSNPYEVLDRSVEPGREHIYRIVAADLLGLEDELDTLRTAAPGTPVVRFRAPDPNPARSSVNLRYYLPATSQGGRYAIAVLDVAGRRVAQVEEGEFAPEGEERRVVWDLRNDQGSRVSAGVYLIRLSYSPRAPVAGDPIALVQRVVVLP